MNDNIQDSGIWQRPEVPSNDGWFDQIKGFVLAAVTLAFVFVGIPLCGYCVANQGIRPEQSSAQRVNVPVKAGEGSEWIGGPYEPGTLHFSRPVSVLFRYPGGRTDYLRNVSYVCVDAGPRQFCILGEPVQAEAIGNDRVEVTFRKF